MTAARLYPPWRIEGHATPFHPWAPLSTHWTLAEALSRQSAMRATHQFYALRIRAHLQ